MRDEPAEKRGDQEVCSMLRNRGKGYVGLTLLGGFGKRLSWILGLSSSKTDKLGTSIGEGGIHKDGAETFEAILESSRIVPVASTDVASIICWNTTTVDHHAENNEADNCDNLDHAEDELNYGKY